ncbi:MAG: DsbA family protein [Geminicoccaceae bacterium]
MIRRLLFLVLGLVLLVGAPAARAEDATKLPVGEIEKIVKEYLLREPEVIYQAIQELQRRRDAEEASKQKDLVAQHGDEIFMSKADPVLGNPDGDVTMVEFFDYHCGYCRSMVPGMRALLEKDTKLRLVMKEFPILGPDSVTASKAALAAAKQGRYSDMHFALMGEKDLSEPSVMAVAKRLGLDQEKLAADMKSPEVASVIDANMKLAQTLNINGTPSFVIGEEIMGGAAPISDIQAKIGSLRGGASG